MYDRSPLGADRRAKDGGRVRLSAGRRSRRRRRRRRSVDRQQVADRRSIPKPTFVFRLGRFGGRNRERRQRQSQWDEGSSIFLVLSSSSSSSSSPGRVRYHCFSGPPAFAVLCCPRKARKWVARFFPNRPTEEGRMEEEAATSLTLSVSSNVSNRPC